MPTRTPFHRSHLRLPGCWLLVALAVLSLAGCGKKSSPLAPQATGGGIESANAVTATVGKSGGEIVARSASGTEYRLDIPAGALAVPTTITITPVASLAAFPLSGGFAGGLDVQPAGLEFAQAATLEITTGATAPAGTFLAALSARNDGSAYALAPAATNPGRITIVVPRFAAPGGVAGGGATRHALAHVDDGSNTVILAGFGSEEDLKNLVLVGAFSNAAFISQVADLVATGASAGALAAVFHDWFTQVLLAEIQDARTDDALLQACGDFAYWKELQLQSHSSPLPDDETAGRDALAPQFRSAFDGNNTLMAEQQSFEALNNCLFWRDQAGFFGVATLANRLDPVTLRADLKLRIDFGEPIDLPIPLQVGFPNTLEVPIGVIFEGHGSEVTPAHFFCEVSAVGADIEHASGNTGVFPNSSSREGYATGITARSNGLITVHVQASLVPIVVLDSHGVANFDISDITDAHDYLLSGLDVSGRWEGRFNDTRTDNETGNVTTIDLPFVVTFTQNQNAVSGRWQAFGLDDNDQPIPILEGTVSATLSGATLLDWSLEQSVPGPGHYTGQASVSADGNTITTHFSGDSQGGSHDGTSTLSRAATAGAARMAARRR